MDIYKTGVVITVVSFIGLIASGFIYNLPLCLACGILMGAGLSMWAIGDKKL